MTRLHDGTVVVVRRAGPSDEPVVRSFLVANSPDARRLRLFAGGIDVDGAARATLQDDSVDRASLLTLTRDAIVVSHGIFARLYGSRAEVAFEVADGWHDRGATAAVLNALEDLARERGFARFEADVFPQCPEVVEVLRRGAPGPRVENRVVHVVWDL